MSECLSNVNEGVCGRLTLDCDKGGAVGAEDLRSVEDVGSDTRVGAAVFRRCSEDKRTI